MRAIATIPFALIIFTMVVPFSVSGFSIEDEVRITETHQEFGPKMAVDEEGYSHIVNRISNNGSLQYRKVNSDGLTVIGPK